MTSIRKVALLHLGVVLLASATFVTIALIAKNVWAANAGWAWLSLLSLEERMTGGRLDERETSVIEKSTLFGYRVFWVGFTVACLVVPYSYAFANKTKLVDIFLITWLPMAGWALFGLARGLAILVQDSRV